MLKQCLEARRTDEKAPLECKESFYFEPVCIDRRRGIALTQVVKMPLKIGMHTSPRDSVNVYRAIWMCKIDDLNPRKHSNVESH